MEIVAKNKWFPTIKELALMLFTFALTTFAWIFFRADDMTHALQYILSMAKNLETLLTTSLYKPYATILLLLTIFIVVEWAGRARQYALSHLFLGWKKPLRYAFYFAIIASIFWFGGQEQQFIYFQF